MLPNSPASRLVHGLLVAGLIGAIIGLSFIPLVSHGRSIPALATQSEDATGGESGGLQWDDTHLFALPDGADASALPAYAMRAADDLVQADAARAESHLQRGPPIA